MNRTTSKAPAGLTAGQLGHLDTSQQKLVELLLRFGAVNAELSRFLGSAHLLLLQVAEFLDQLQYPVDHPLLLAGAAFSRALASEIKAEGGL